MIALSLKLAATASAAGIISVHVCGSWTPGHSSSGGTVGVASSGNAKGISTPYQCPSAETATGMEIIANGSSVPDNTRAYWQINAPQGLSIFGAQTVGQDGMVSYGVNAKMGWYGDFYWNSGRSTVHPGQVSYTSPLMNSPDFGWEVVCRWSKCNGASEPGETAVLELQVDATETSGPTITVSPGSLGAATGWVRGWWPVSFTADGPTGACQLAASVGSVSVSQPVNEPQNQTTWHQCPAGYFAQSLDTASFPSQAGSPLRMWARDAAYDFANSAYLSSTVTKLVNVDNEPVQLSISGPTDAPATAGTQYLDVTATAGPSGMGGIRCSLDGGPDIVYPGASARIAVNGIAVHHLECLAHNRALDSSGIPASSAPATWTLSIRQPTAIGASFSHVADALRCVSKRERVFIPAHWVTGMSGGRRVHVRLPSEWRTIKVVHCHPQIVRRRVRIHGRWRVVRVAVFPHVVQQYAKRVSFGKRTAIGGWLGTINGTALAGALVRVYSAPDNGLQRFSQTAVTTTRSDGTWAVALSPGPSRLIQAVYGGSTVTEPTASSYARVIVPAVVDLTIRPRKIGWGGTIRLSGRVLGGYIPGTGQQLLRLRIGASGYFSTVGIPDVQRDGRFQTTWTFHLGVGAVNYWFSVSTLSEADYPYAPGSSKRVTVTVGRG